MTKSAAPTWVAAWPQRAVIPSRLNPSSTTESSRSEPETTHPSWSKMRASPSMPTPANANHVNFRKAAEELESRTIGRSPTCGRRKHGRCSSHSTVLPSPSHGRQRSVCKASACAQPCRRRWCRTCALASDRSQDADAAQIPDQRGSTVTDKRQGQACRRQHARSHTMLRTA